MDVAEMKHERTGTFTANQEQPHPRPKKVQPNKREISTFANQSSMMHTFDRIKESQC